MAKKVQKYWLMKSEPDCYSITDLKRDTTTMWDGTRNYQVRNMIRDEIQVGDLVLFYHSNTKEIGAVGIMKVVRGAYPDPTQFDSKSEHPDLTSDPKDPRWFAVDVQYVSSFLRTITLNEMKLDSKLAGMIVTKKGSRLSVTPVTKKHFDRVCKLAER